MSAHVIVMDPPPVSVTPAAGLVNLTSATAKELNAASRVRSFNFILKGVLNAEEGDWASDSPFVVRSS